MSSINVENLQDGLSFGARVAGVTFDDLNNVETRSRLKTIFEDRGLIVFTDIEPSQRMHVALSDVFGPLKEHPVPVVDRVDGDAYPGVIDMNYLPGKTTAVVEIDGRRLSGWLPWHFDHCYNDQLNRAGVLRAIDIPPKGGETLFADGIELYRDFPNELRCRIEEGNILYNLDMAYGNMRFGIPAGFRLVQEGELTAKVVAQAKTQPRAVHPAVWTRPTGEKVMHISPWMALGIEGQENLSGDALLEEACQAVASTVRPYRHSWKTSEMVIWDNWRLLHSVAGADPAYARRMQRTTIKGDYGLGYFEKTAMSDLSTEIAM